MFPLAFLSGIGPLEMVVIGTVAVLLFGSRLPSVARSAGKSLTEFKRGMQDLQSDFKRSIDLEEAMRDNPSSDTKAAGASNTDTFREPPRAEDSSDGKTSSDEPSKDGQEEFESYPEPRSPVI